MPNVTGNVGGDYFNRSWGFHRLPKYEGVGCIEAINKGETHMTQGNNEPYYFNGFNINLSRNNSNYIEELNEVRVKSVISNGFIKLY